MDIVVVKETIYFYAGCVCTPSKNVKNTEGRKVLLQFCFK